VDAAELAKPVHWPHLIDPLRPSWGEPYRSIVARMAEAALAAGCREVSDPRLHCRLRGSCGSGRPSAERRVSQIGSWWETITATYAEPSAHLYSGVNQLPGS
jgi:hypothetical protein